MLDNGIEFEVGVVGELAVVIEDAEVDGDGRVADDLSSEQSGSEVGDDVNALAIRIESQSTNESSDPLHDSVGLAQSLGIFVVAAVDQLEVEVVEAFEPPGELRCPTQLLTINFSKVTRPFTICTVRSVASALSIPPKF